jgi:hypothetical protein
MTRVQLEPARVDAGLAFAQDELLDRMSADPGLCSSELLVDRERGSLLLVTTWTDQGAAGRVDALLEELPADAAVRAGDNPSPVRVVRAGPAVRTLRLTSRGTAAVTRQSPHTPTRRRR